jgi:hypothetical protein
MDRNVRFARAAMERHLAPEGRKVVTNGVVWDGPIEPGAS